MRSAGCMAALIALAAGSAPALAVSGRIVTEAGKPIVGARACLLISGVEELCVEVGADGAYRLPDTREATVAISAKGFFPTTALARDLDQPVVLEPAAALRARLVDASTGKPVSRGEVRLAYASGRVKGPFPVNAAGVVVNALPAGDAIATGKAEGYVESQGEPIVLEVGKETEVILRLRPAGEAPLPAEAR